MNDYKAALQSKQCALTIRIKLFGEEHESTADSYRELGVTQAIMHDYASALQSQQRSLAIRMKLFGEEHESTADTYRTLGVTQANMHDSPHLSNLFSARWLCALNCLEKNMKALPTVTKNSV